MANGNLLVPDKPFRFGYTYLGLRIVGCQRHILMNGKARANTQISLVSIIVPYKWLPICTQGMPNRWMSRVKKTDLEHIVYIQCDAIKGNICFFLFLLASVTSDLKRKTRKQK